MGSQEPRPEVAPGKEPEGEQSESADNREFREWARRKETGLVVFGGVLLVIVLVVGYALHRLEESDFCIGGGFCGMGNYSGPVVQKSSPVVVRVPDVRGLMKAEAVSLLEDLGLAVEIAHVPSGRKTGVVLRQDPPPGLEGRAVWLDVAAPKVPDVVGIKLHLARQELRFAGYEVDVVKSSWARTWHRITWRYAPGEVFDQDPAPEERRVPYGALVTVRVWIAGPWEAQARATLKQISASGRAELLRALRHQPEALAELIARWETDPRSEGWAKLVRRLQDEPVMWTMRAILEREFR